VGRSAYYVTAYYSRSAHKLIGGRVKLSGQALQKFMAGVVEGLLELKRNCSRAHGNLKPSNVLFEGEGDLDESTIVLTDPAPADQLPGDTRAAEAADLVAVGELLCQLVLHKLFKGSQSWPIPKSPEWTRLGSKREGWRDLCNKLLNPDGVGELTLEEMAAKIGKLKQGKRYITPMRVIVVVGLLLVGAGFWVGMEYVQLKSDWRQLCREYEGWVYRFQKDVKANPDRLARIKRDPYVEKAIARLLADGAQLDPKRLSGNETMVISALAENPPIAIDSPEG